VTTAAESKPAAPPAPDPLAMAVNCAANVLVYAAAQDTDPVDSYVKRLGERGFDAAQLGACMAQVAIAQDTRRIADAAEAIAADVKKLADHFRWGK
jgi:hypothetical protein